MEDPRQLSIEEAVKLAVAFQAHELRMQHARDMFNVTAAGIQADLHRAMVSLGLNPETPYDSEWVKTGVIKPDENSQQAQAAASFAASQAARAEQAAALAAQEPVAEDPAALGGTAEAPKPASRPRRAAVVSGETAKEPKTA